MNTLVGLGLLIANIGIGVISYSLLDRDAYAPGWAATAVLVLFVVVGTLIAVTVIRNKTFEPKH